MWLFNPTPLQNDSSKEYSKMSSNFLETSLDKNQIEFAQKQYEFAVQYNEENRIDLNYNLTTYVDINYQEIWCNEFMKAKKNEIKKNSSSIILRRF